MAAHISVLDSVDKPLPDLPYQNKPQHLSASAQTTKDAPVPKVWVAQQPGRKFSDSADVLLKSLSYDPRLEATIPEVEESFYLCNEADVARATNLYLLHPINQLLTAFIKQQTDRRAALRCFCEKVQNDSTRTDITWELVSALNPDTRYTIAVLELKNTNGIVRSQFQAAEATPFNKAALIDQAQSAKGEYETLFDGNALWVAKQLTKYALSTATPYVGAFDWRSMVLFNFNEMSGPQNAGEAMEGFAMAEDGVRVIFRRALLGFLYQGTSRRLNNLGVKQALGLP